MGLCLTGLMILLFLGNLRATVAVMLSIPISCLATFLILDGFSISINTMVLGGLALALSRLIDNSVVVLENIFDTSKWAKTTYRPRKREAKRCSLRSLPQPSARRLSFFRSCCLRASASTFSRCSPLPSWLPCSALTLWP